MRRLLIPVAGLVLLAGTGWLIGVGQIELRRERPMLPLTFAHADHTTVNCVTCHHNFVDDSGTGLCFDCHKTDPTVNAVIETHFHDLCRGCHVDRQVLGEDGGPTRSCDDCHTADDAP